MWSLTVNHLIDISAAISLIVKPLLRKVSTSTSRGVSAGKVTDRGFGGGSIGEQIEPAALSPCVARQPLDRQQLDVMIETGPGFGENLVEHPAHGEHRRSRIDTRAVDDDLAQLASGGGGTLDDGDVMAARRQQRRGSQAADARADHDDTRCCHVLPQHPP